MDTIQSDEGLRLWIINHLSEKLGKHAILKGGMVLRLLNCPRYTNDLDYVFVPFRSKKEIGPLIDKAMADLKGARIEKRLHSTNVRYDVVFTNASGTFRTHLEANVSDSCESEPISTADLAISNKQSPHIVRVMRFDIALANKLAAWNERELMRDLYDAYFLYRHLGKTPHLPTLRSRLQKINYARRVKNSSLPKSMTLPEFLARLEQNVRGLTDDSLHEELRDTLDQDQIAGLAHKMKVGLIQMIEGLLTETSDIP
ncbi:MAG: nucleotidyl transferase AbiEii/AbiGii toxin family protein [Deltaproteobacteria bacterium]|nr:nucleotidyl transferase AbiEii/AbiGii toxin family protein [Deltaproteobacteria bacterium]